MAELQLTEEQRERVSSLLSAVGQDAALRERFRADPTTVLGEYGLAHLVPSDVQLEVEVEEPEIGALAGPSSGGGPIHLDLAHIDQHMDVHPLPPGHSDWSHVDGTFLVADNIKVTPVFRIKLMPMPSTDPD
jgi:hypothetical protein